MEPLSLLREFTRNNQLDQITVEGQQIAFGKRKTFSRTEDTAWKRGQKNTGNYSLESLVHFVRNLDKSVREYLRLPRAPGVQHVPYLERKALEDYLKGRTDTDPAIQSQLSLPQAATDLASDGQPAAKKARLDEAQAGEEREQEGGLLAHLLSHERQLQDRNSQLTIPDKNFKQVLDLLAKVQRPPPSQPQAHHGDQRRPSSAGKHAHGHHREDGARPKTAESVAMAKPPLIIVPAAATAKINIFNAKPFLAEGRYITPEQARAEGGKKQSLVVMERNFGRSSPVMYQIVDQAPAAKSHDWERVAAIFVTGAAWQFKDYPFKGSKDGETVDTFTHCLGVYLGIKGESMPETIRKWNVKRFELQAKDRHRDLSIAQEVWKAVDDFMRKHIKKRKLAY